MGWFLVSRLPGWNALKADRFGIGKRGTAACIQLSPLFSTFGSETFSPFSSYLRGQNEREKIP